MVASSCGSSYISNVTTAIIMPKIETKLASADRATMAHVELSDLKLKVNKNGNVILIADAAKTGAYAEANKNSSGEFQVKRLLKEYASERANADDWEHGIISYIDDDGNEREIFFDLASDPEMDNGKIRYRGKADLEKYERRIGKGTIDGALSKMKPGTYTAAKADLVLSSYDEETLRSEFDSYYSSFEDANSSARLSLQLVDESGNATTIDESNRLDLINKEYKFGPATAGFTLAVNPDYSFSVNTPRPKWYQTYQYLQPSRYSANLGAGLTWDAKAFIDPGVSNAGALTLANQTFNGPSVSAGASGVTATLSSGVDLSANLYVGALNPDNLIFGADQRFGFNMGVGTGGVNFQNTSTGINWTKPSIDALTGLEVGVGVTPWIGLQIGIGVNIPHFGSVNFVEGGPRVTLPLNINGKGNASNGYNLTGDFTGQLGASVTALPFWPGGGWTHNIGTYNFIPQQNFTLI